MELFKISASLLLFEKLLKILEFFSFLVRRFEREATGFFIGIVCFDFFLFMC